MKKLLIVTIWAVFLTACGGSANSTNSANSANTANATSVTNSNINSTEKTEKKSVDTTPVKMTSDELAAQDGESLQKYKGRTLILYGQLEKWTTGEMEISFAGYIVNCSGDYTEYMDAINLYEKKSKRVWVDFRGVLEDAKGGSFDDRILTMKNCVITDIGK
ncbi:MAG TPA: hypothetical protein PKY59_13930 [Pyrinomonadaceae bacterium]|nr:hypothetical protein [Pyrinomonadaceae bacterium]